MSTDYIKVILYTYIEAEYEKSQKTPKTHVLLLPMTFIDFFEGIEIPPFIAFDEGLKEDHINFITWKEFFHMDKKAYFRVENPILN